MAWVGLKWAAAFNVKEINIPKAIEVEVRIVIRY